MKPLVSIIIPTYNRAHLIVETLNSVLSQTYTNWECIVVDDGSTDDTDEVLAGYCKQDNRFKYFHRPEDRLAGGNAARNYGFEMSKGDYIQWFDSDDVMLMDFINTKIEVFTNELSFVICSGYSVDENLIIKHKIELFEETNLFKDYTLWKLRIFPSSVMVKKAKLLGKSLFKETLVRGQETELFSRLFFGLNNTEYLIVNKHLFYYRQHFDTKSKKNKSYIKSFKKSESYNSVQNILKGVKLEDTEIINFHYKILIHHFFISLFNKHYSNSRYILNNLLKVLKIYDLKEFFKLWFFGNIFLIGKRSIFKIEKNLKSFKFT